MKSIELPKQEFTVGRKQDDTLNGQTPDIKLLANHPNAKAPEKLKDKKDAA